MSKNHAHKEEHYWVSTAQIIELDETLTKMITQPCIDFQDKLLTLSGLSSISLHYILLKEVLNRFLRFEKGTKQQEDKEKEDSKLYAVVAGSYPAYLAKAVKQYDDIDVSVMVKDFNMTYTALWKVINRDIGVMYNYMDPR